MHVWFYRSDAVQTCGLTGVCQVEDAVRGGAVRGLMWDNGHRVGNSRGERDQKGGSRKGLLESGTNHILGAQYSWTIDRQKKEKKRKGQH